MKRKIILLVAALALIGVVVFFSWAPIRSRIHAWTASAPAQADQAHAVHDVAQQAGQSGAAAQGQRKVLFWYDAMNPAIHSDKPGKARDGMDLVPQYADDEEAKKEMPVGSVMISPQKQQLIGVRTATVELEHLQRTIRAVGRVAFDETKVAHIHTKVTGYIEDVFVDSVGKSIKKGDPLFTIYSPDLVSTQQEYLIALRGKKYLSDAPYPEVTSGAESLLRATRERLQLWDVSDKEIQTLEKEGKVKRTLTMYSPATGIVTDRTVFGGGRYVTPDMDLYTVVDLSTAWVLAEIYEYEVPYVQVGQTAAMHVSYATGKTYTGKIKIGRAHV
jgi:Cu(I)/Ag(I) efflux system membrane fusion protein